MAKTRSGGIRRCTPSGQVHENRMGESVNGKNKRLSWKTRPAGVSEAAQRKTEEEKIQRNVQKRSKGIWWSFIHPVWDRGPGTMART